MFAVHVENLALIKPERFHNVLVGVGVNRLFVRLAQQIEAALRRGDVPVSGEYEIIGGKRVGSGKKAKHGF